MVHLENATDLISRVVLVYVLRYRTRTLHQSRNTVYLQCQGGSSESRCPSLLLRCIDDVNGYKTPY
jgi:hypothetical protein